MTQLRKGYLHSYGAFFLILVAFFDIMVIAGNYHFVLFANQIEVTQDLTFILVLTLIVFLSIATSHSFYRSYRTSKLLTELGELFSYWVSTFAIIATLIFVFENKMPMPSDVLLVWFISTLTFLSISRVILRTFVYKLRAYGRNYRRVAIIGATPIAERLHQSITSNDWMGLKFSGFFDDRCQDRFTEDFKNKQVDSIDTLLSRIAEDEIDIVYITLPMSAQKRIKSTIDKLSLTNVSIYYAPDFYTFDLLRAHWDNIEDQPLISIIETPFVGDNTVLKRLEDVVLSFLILCCIAIPMLIVAILIKLDSSGPAIYRQKRYGLDGKSFTIYKFRTMRSTPDDKVFKQATQNDPRVTRLGRFLRKYSIDELPQFINVLQGRMSVVGPRPHPLALDDEHLNLIKRYNLRFKVKPGITGWAQVNGYRGETKELHIMDKRIQYDLEYIKRWSVLFDLKIIFLTFWTIIKPVNAY